MATTPCHPNYPRRFVDVFPAARSATVHAGLVSLRTGLVIEVPEAETVVGSFRERMDRNALLGVPAHITLLFPFVQPADVDQGLLDRLAELFAGQPAFDFQLVRTGWFEAQDVLWLAPDPSDRFKTLTALAYANFPDHPPWGGEFADIVPHLTVGHSHPVDELREAERQLQYRLPIRCRAGAVSLFAQVSPEGRWQRRASFSLGSPDPYNLERFVSAQDAHATYRDAVSELRAGRKRTHWMWFVFPQLAGLGLSPTSRHFAISGLDEAKAYLAHPVLGPRLVECAGIVAALDNLSAIDIFGGIDAQKLRSSMTLFTRAADGRPEQEVFRQVVRRYFDDVADPATEALL